MISTKPIQWHGFGLLEKIILLVLPALALLTIALRFTDEVYLRRLARMSGGRSIIVWLVDGNNALFVTAALLLMSAGFLLWRRHHLINDKRLWFSSGCPYCQERELVRVTRKSRDRYYRFAGIPAYRFACRNCNWRGLRIGRQEHSPERDRELEEALRRFRPDGGSGVALVENGYRPSAGYGKQELPIGYDSDLLVSEANRRMEPYTSNTRAEDDTTEASAPPTTDGDPGEPDDMEWLWRRPPNP